MRKMLLLTFSFLLTTLSAFAQTEPAQRIIGVRLSDIKRYIGDTSAVPALESTNEMVKSQLKTKGEVEAFYGVFPQSEPVNEGDSISYMALSVYRVSSGKSVWGRGNEEDEQDSIVSRADLYKIVYSKEYRTVYVNEVRSFGPSELNFSAEVSLVERKLVLSDAGNGLKIVMPIGVGSFDEGVMNQGITTLLTPRLKSAYLSKNTTITKRHKPRYFADKPFIRIVDGYTDKVTAIGFHTEINDGFVRGFDSHGCMRLRDDDLYLLHDVVIALQEKLPLSIAYNIADSSDHPAPKRNKVYKRVKNVGDLENPRIVLDRDNLMQTEYKEALAPFSVLVDEADDHYSSKYQYETMETWERQRKADKQICIDNYSSMPESSNSDRRAKQKAIDDCIKEGGRKLTLKDKLYRWWMH